MSLRLVPAIHRATHRIGLFLADLRDDPLSQGESHILALLATSGPATIAHLHRGLAHKRSTLTSILDRLAERGYILRESDPRDRRTFRVRLTAAGTRVAAKVSAWLEKLERSALAQVTPGDLRGFNKVVNNLQEHAEGR